MFKDWPCQFWGFLPLFLCRALGFGLGIQLREWGIQRFIRILGFGLRGYLPLVSREWKNRSNGTYNSSHSSIPY